MTTEKKQWPENILVTHSLICVCVVSLPHLVDFDWRVDVKTSSDNAARMAQPTCIVQMKASACVQHLVGW